MSFDHFGLDPLILSALTASGYTTPTPIQSLAIPEVMAGRDILASADTGTGKTAAFMLPALNRLTKESAIKSKGPRVLVLTPTRELATQVSQASKKYGSSLKRIRTVSILGGMPYPPQKRDLRNFVDILVATPGRLLDHHREGAVDFSRVELLVLDEADRMLDLGFYDDVKIIADALPPERQTLMFSATLGRKILSLAECLTRSPKRIEIPKSQTTNDNVTQSILFTEGHDHKKKVLQAILKRDGVHQAIVFTATKQGADDLADHLVADGASAVALHGDMRQRHRAKTIARIRSNTFQILVATDVAARGIDIQGISHVINFDLPRTAEDYTHRIGRTGRAGSEGRALTLINYSEKHRLRSMERVLGHTLDVETIPGLEPAPRRDAPRRNERSSRAPRAFGGGSFGGKREAPRHGQAPRSGRPEGDRAQRPAWGNRTDTRNGQAPRHDRPEGRLARSSWGSRDDSRNGQQPRQGRPEGRSNPRASGGQRDGSRGGRDSRPGRPEGRPAHFARDSRPQRGGKPSGKWQKRAAPR